MKCFIPLRLIQPVVVFLLLANLACAVGCRTESKAPGGWVPLDRQGDQPLFLNGVYKPGSNVTEPRPAESRYLKTDSGGILVVDAGAGFYLKVVMRQPLKESLYVKVEYENPEHPGIPSVNDAVLGPDDEGFVFSSPTVYKGLKGYSDYTIKVLIFRSRTDSQPIDTLTQRVRCYVDTTTSKIKVWSELTHQ